MSEENKEDSQKPIVEEQKPESPKEEILDSKNEEPIQENKTEDKEQKEEDKPKEKEKPKEEPKIEEKLNEEPKIKIDLNEEPKIEVDLNDEPNIKADLNENKKEDNNVLVEQSKNEVDIKSAEENKEDINILNEKGDEIKEKEEYHEYKEPEMISEDKYQEDHHEEEMNHEIVFENQEQTDEPEFYVSNPTLTKDTIGSFITYTVQGVNLIEPIVRRFSDFDLLRAKLRLRWPGIYLPRLPHKKTVGNKNKEVVDMRLEMINRFCYKISSLKKIFMGAELALFLKNEPEAMKELSDLPAQSFEDLFYKYAQSFPNASNDFDFNEYKGQLDNFYKTLSDSIPHRKSLLETVKKIKEHYLASNKSFVYTMSLFDCYEKEWLSKIRKNEQMIFRNNKNQKISTCLSQLEISFKNEITPYDNFYNTIHSDLLTAEAYIETYESLKKLLEEKEKLNSKLKDTLEKMQNNKSGKKSLASIFTFKSIEEESNSLMQEKENYERNISHLTNIINICVYKLKQEADLFRISSLRDYYTVLFQLKKDVKTSTFSSNQLMKFVLDEPHLKNIEIDFDQVHMGK